MTKRTFTMPFEPMTIKHLGLRLYSTLPPVLSELVSNAYDAESPKVEIKVPTGEITAGSEVIVRDFGHGMDENEIQDEFLPIGRNRRGVSSTQLMSKSGKVRVTGRKGLGKLSAFGVAEEMEVRAVKDKKAITLRLRYPEMEEWSKRNPGRAYEPTLVEERTGRTTDVDGVEITLRGLYRTRRINEDIVRRGLARRLAMIGDTFQVYVNGNSIQPGDRMDRSKCVKGYSWSISETPDKGEISSRLSLTGWIGFVDASSQENRGVDIFANNKAVELGSYFHYASTHAQFARAHIIGEVNADFLDGPEDDLVATARNSVVWESAIGNMFQDWGQKLLKWAFEKWIELRKKEKEELITKVGGFDDWLKGRQESEQRVARRLVKILVDDDAINTDQARPLLEIVKGSVETIAFRELVETLEEETPSAAALIKLFDEWRVIEAREYLQLGDGRISAINQLEKYINRGALEVKEMQPLLTNNLWLLNMRWNEASEQKTYSKLLRENCKEPKDLEEENRRIDIVGITEGGRMTIVEIKRPEKTLNRKDLEQIAQYVDWARANIMGTGPDAPRQISGLLIVGKLSDKGDVGEQISRLAGSDIRVEIYRDLYEAARKEYKEVERRLEKIAPEYTRSRRKRKKLGTK